MVDLTGSARRLYRRVIGADTRPQATHPGVPAVTDGVTAVAVTEAALAEAAALGAVFPAAAAGDRFRQEAVTEKTNLLGRPLSVTGAAGPRGQLAAANGLALSGLRAAAFVSGPDLGASLDLLAQAAGRRLPLVIHLAARAGTGSGEALGSGHDALHAAAASGALQFVAADVQEAVDFALIARRAAETALLPALVAMDAAETALSVQDVLLPSRETARRVLGAPEDTIHCGTASQELLFGKHRRRVPRWHDLARPLRLGGPAGEAAYPAARAGAHAYFDPHAAAAVDDAFAAYAAATGRSHAPVTAYRVDDAKLVFVALGAAIPVAEAAVDRLRSESKVKAGVVGIRLLRPFPAAKVVELLTGRKAVVVLERVDAPVSGEAPLTAEVRSALDRARENARYGAASHPGLPGLSEKDAPRLGTAYYGLGGPGLDGSDLIAHARGLEGAWRSPVFLGLDFTPDSRAWPKRQVMIDALRRSYPGAEGLGVRAAGAPADLRPEGAITLAVCRMAGRGGEGLAGETAQLLQRATGGRVRTRPGLTWARFGRLLADRVTFAPEVLRDPGAAVRAELAVWTVDDLPVDPAVLDGLADGGALLVERHPGAESFWSSLPAAVHRALAERKLSVYAVAALPEASAGDRRSRLLGAVFGVLAAEARIALNPRKVTAARAADRDPDAGEDPFTAGMESVSKLEPAGLPEDAGAPVSAEPEVPASVRRLGKAEDTVDSLARFWDQVGVVARDGGETALTPDPYLAAGAVPPLTATFHDQSRARTLFPVFDPALCTACGACWSSCPDAALEPAVLEPAALLDAGMTRVRERGGNADALRMLAGKLAGRVNQELAGAESAGATAGPLFRSAFDALMEKTPLPEERKTALAEAMDLVVAEIGPLPVSRTEPFFRVPEMKKKGSGELFALAVSPDACKGCGVCAAVCEPDALTLVPDSADRRTEAATVWRLAGTLPDPRPETVARAAERSDVGPLPAAFLTRAARSVLSGGDAAEAGSGERIAVRQVLAVASHHFEPRMKEFREHVDNVRDELAKTIREMMATALPTGDLDALARGLDRVDRPDADLADLSTRIEAAFETGRVDVARLRRLVDTARKLADLARTLDAPARAPLSVVVGPGPVAAWAGAFPDNPFAVPVTVDAVGETAELARGILEGQIREAVDALRLLRRARVELDRPAEAPGAIQDLAGLGWRDLTPEERRFLPPLFLILSEDALSGPGLAGLVNLLDEALPVKVLLLAEGHLGLSGDVDPLAVSRPSGGLRHDPAIWALAHPRSYVLQSSIAHGAHLSAGVAGALDHDGPALIRLHAPSPERHGFAADLAPERARRAVAARAVPLFRRAPRDPVAGRPPLELEGNPFPEALWPRNRAGEVLTPAAWASEETRFGAWFRAPSPDDPQPTALMDYLKLNRQERAGKTPTVGEGDRALVAAPALVQAVEERMAAWSTLQELAGAALPPAALAEARDRAEAQVREAQAREIESLRADYEAKLAAARGEVTDELTRRVRGRLLALAGHGEAGNGEGGRP